MDEPDDIDAFYASHYNFLDPRETATREAAVPHLATRCPVTSSDALGGFWVVNRYELIKEVAQDWETFSSVPEKAVIPRAKGKYVQPPIDIDPPGQRDFRRLLNPFLTPQRIERFAPGIRSLVNDLIDGFVEDGSCDLARQFAQPFPGRMLYRFVLGIDDDEVPMVQEWTRKVLFEPLTPEAAIAQERWNTWMHDTVERRRREPRRDDLLDAIVHATLDGEPISDRERIGSFAIIILGGFSTTSDSLTNTMLRLAENLPLQRRLRDHPEDIPMSLDEFFRFDPPLSGQSRLCVRDTQLGGQTIRAGQRVLMNFHAANRDPEEFSDPNRLDVDRARNRHLSFGLGTHRCIGSNVARQNLKIALEELLPRLGDFSVSEGQTTRRETSGSWGLAYLPLSFAPGVRRVAN